MTKRILVGFVISVCAIAAHAGPPIQPGVPVDLDMLSMAAQHSATNLRYAEAYAYELSADVTEESVGDPDSFGRHKTYLGVAQTATVALQADCSTYPPDSPGVCIVLDPAPGTTSIDEVDLAIIELPEKSTKSILCFTFTPFAYWQWINNTGSAQTASMFLRPLVRIESEVLDDPALVDPGTGLPFNGVLLDHTISSFLQERTLNAGESDTQFRATTRSCTGGLVNVRVLRDTYGLSDSVIKDFFKSPITVSFGVRGEVSMVDWANYSVGIRLYGDD
jgi:hypothetical protein